MKKEKFLAQKNIVAIAVILLIAVLLEAFVFNFSTFRSMGLEPVVITKDAHVDETGEYYSEIVTVDREVKNIDVQLDIENYDCANVSVVLTDEGDKYEYSTPEYVVTPNVKGSGYSNVYPFDKVHTIQVVIKVPKGVKANITSIIANANKEMDFKPIRMITVFTVMLILFFVWNQSRIHEVYFDSRKNWQKIVILIMAILLILLGKKIIDSNELLRVSPWPHHMQYQQLAHSLKEGTVELKDLVADARLLEADNPYDTIALQIEGIDYNMDYAFYNGKYYAYFGIVPEVLFFYPHYLRTGQDLSNSRAILYAYMLFVVGAFLLSYEWTKRYRDSVPYVLWLLVTVGLITSANFVYLASKPDIYNIPVLSAAAFTMLGIGFWLLGLNNKKKAPRIVGIAIGSFAMAMVAGCRPQQLLISGVAVIIFLFEDGFKNRKIFTKKTVLESVAFLVPYILIAMLVCWYNYARFGNILDFGATYSLTTNDMNHRGFNFNRLFRGLYSFFLQPANIGNDFPFLFMSNVDGNYMGRYLSEFTYGGMLVSNGFLYSVLLSIVIGIKKIDKKSKIIIGYLLISAFIIGAFDVNGAGVLYRYTCDLAPALSLAAAFLWLCWLDKGKAVTDYKFISRLATVCMILGFGYSFLTFIAGDNSTSLINANRQLFYSIMQYFRF